MIKISVDNAAIMVTSALLYSLPKNLVVANIACSNEIYPVI